MPAKALQRRMFLILSACTIGLVALLGRLFYIQVFAPRDMQGHDLIAASVDQRSETFVIDSGRGDILDRKGQSFTGSSIRGVLVVPLASDGLDSAKVQQLAKILLVLPDQLQKGLAKIDRPALLRIPDPSGKDQVVEVTDDQAKAIDQLQLPGVSAQQVKVRYDNTSLARHVLGFIGQDPALVTGVFGGKYPANEQIGKMGLEYLFQDELRGLGRSKKISYFIDGDKRPVNGLGMRISLDENKSLSVKTTLDKGIQAAVETAMDKDGLQKGSVVVLDAKTEDILAMASRPQFDQTVPVKGNEYPVNKAVQADFPGSVFKAVIAQAALDKGLVRPDDHFHCPGYIEIGDGRLNCWTTHGDITAEQGFAQSCNVVFAQLAMKLGRKTIEEYAAKMGLGQAAIPDFIGKPQIYGEDKGSVITKQDTSLRLLANTGIGQEDVRTSPLQVAHMMAVFANQGQAGTPRLIQSLLTTEDQMALKVNDASGKKQVLNQQTTALVRNWMRQVVASPKGTAHFLNDAAVEIAGKTGTAQTGKDGVHHHWFAGYAPASQPKYIIVVMGQDMTDDNGGRVVQQVTKDIVNRIF